MDPATARIVDANANRAREGLRVMEDHARFVLEDTGLAERLKQVRHDLSAACAAFPPGTLLSTRDAAGDVGRTITTAQEKTRAGPDSVAIAAARRVTEALRSLEEYSKCHDAALAARFEALRYSVYDYEQSLLIGSPRRQRLRQARLYVLITESVCRGPCLDAARAALDGGADVLQLREKTLPDRELLRRAEALQSLTAKANALLIVNDRPDIAKLANADGVHVGQDDLSVDAARRIIGRDRIVGTSTHSIEQARAAMESRPDYIAVGPMFASSTKPQDRIPGPALLAEVLRMTSQDGPLIVAIGGIDAGNVERLTSVGCRCTAVCAAIIGRDDVRAAAAEMRHKLSGT